MKNQPTKHVCQMSNRMSMKFRKRNLGQGYKLQFLYIDVMNSVVHQERAERGGTTMKTKTSVLMSLIPRVPEEKRGKLRMLCPGSQRNCFTEQSN